MKRLSPGVSIITICWHSRRKVPRGITTSKYPALRGTNFSVGDPDFLYTTGFIASLNEFHGMHVPSPVRIADHIGQDTPREVLLWRYWR